MKGLINGEDFNTLIKDHDEILKKIEEIKEFEMKYPEFNLSKIKPKEELIELDEKLQEFDETTPEIREQYIKTKINIFNKFKKKSSTDNKLNPTVFHLRINNEKLENTDIKKPVSKEKKKKLFSIKRKKKDKKQGEDKEEEPSKLSKIKGGFGRIKGAIPSRQKKSKDEKETIE
jgi:hypothetical protein